MAVSDRERDNMTSIRDTRGRKEKDRKVVKCPKASWRRKRWSRTERTGILLAGKANQLRRGKRRGIERSPVGRPAVGSASSVRRYGRLAERKYGLEYVAARK